VSEEKPSWNPDDHFQLRMGVGMPEGLVPDDARRISTHRFKHKDDIASSVAGRQIIAIVIRDAAEELIKTIYEQMDRQENDRD
jgi:hypothetical protein